MRYFIIIFITFILSLLLIFYNPYLGVYKEKMTIEFSDIIDDFDWNYKMDNDNLEVSKISNVKWEFSINKNGITNLYFIYSNKKEVKYTIYYKLKIKNNKIYWLEGYGEGLLTYPNPV